MAFLVRPGVVALATDIRSLFQDTSCPFDVAFTISPPPAPPPNASAAAAGASPRCAHKALSTALHLGRRPLLSAQFHFSSPFGH